MANGRQDRDAGRGPVSLLGRLAALPNESPLKTILVILVVSLVGSILVAGSAVLLRPRQTANVEAARLAEIDRIIRRLPEIGADRTDVVVEARVVDLESGDYVASIDARTYDQAEAAKDPMESIEIPPARDLAGIGRRARRALVYLVHRKGEPRLLILPVRGRGFGSTLHGYLGLAADTRTVVGLRFYRHGETPGLGALVDSPKWQEQWFGKQVWNQADEPRLGVASGPVEAGTAEAEYLVDGLTGATWTSKGVTNLLRFWLGEDGFGPYLRKLGRGEVGDG